MKKQSKAQQPKPEIPRRVTPSDVIQYHRDKDDCSTCAQGEWDCPQHPFNRNNPPRRKTTVDDGFRPAIPWKPPA